MSWTILDKPKKGSGFPKHGQNLLGDSQVVSLISTTHIIDKSWLTLQKDMFDRGAMILDGQPIATMAAIPIERQGLIIYRVGYEQRNELFRMLARPVRIAPSGNHDGKAER